MAKEKTGDDIAKVVQLLVEVGGVDTVYADVYLRQHSLRVTNLGLLPCHPPLRHAPFLASTPQKATNSEIGNSS